MLMGLVFFGIFKTCVAISANYQPVPKPNGYMRVDIPAAEYAVAEDFPINLEVNKFANDTLPLGGDEQGVEWLDIDYPQLKATIHCSYLMVDSVNFYYHLDNRIERIMMNANFHKPRLVDMVSERDSVIKSTMFINNFGGLTPIEFIATDSVAFILSGTLAMYGGEVNKDSIAPVVDYIHEDIKHLLNNLSR